jgi:hypothetical protein
VPILNEKKNVAVVVSVEIHLKNNNFRHYLKNPLNPAESVHDGIIKISIPTFTVEVSI